VGGTVEVCQLNSIPWEVFSSILTLFNFDTGLLDEGDGVNPSTYYDNAIGDGKMAYIVMDSSDFDPAVDCQELNAAGQIHCDFNDDGILDVEGGANRGWLLLDGTGASDLSDLMLNGYPAPVTLPQWFPGKNGVSNSVFIKGEGALYKISLLPVFNAVCSDTTASGLPTDCPTEFQTGDQIKAGSGVNTYYRVPGFAPFVMTCISKGASDYCPGKNFANVKNNVSTIEGYFVSGYTAGMDIDPDGFDLGVYIISLTK
jgi:hypothetical protein